MDSTILCVEGAEKRRVDVDASVKPDDLGGDLDWFHQDHAAVMLPVECHGDVMQADSEEPDVFAGRIRPEVQRKSTDRGSPDLAAACFCWFGGPGGGKTAGGKYGR